MKKEKELTKEEIEILISFASNEIKEWKKFLKEVKTKKPRAVAND